MMTEEQNWAGLSSMHLVAIFKVILYLAVLTDYVVGPR